MNLREKVMISTFAVFMVEALVHYNLGTVGKHQSRFNTYDDFEREIGK